MPFQVVFVLHAQEARSLHHRGPEGSRWFQMTTQDSAVSQHLSYPQSTLVFSLSAHVAETCWNAVVACAASLCGFGPGSLTGCRHTARRLRQRFWIVLNRIDICGVWTKPTKAQSIYIKYPKSSQSKLRYAMLGVLSHQVNTSLIRSNMF